SATFGPLEISQFRLTAITKTYPNIATIAPLCILVPFAMGRVVCHICRPVEPSQRASLSAGRCGIFWPLPRPTTVHGIRHKGRLRKRAHSRPYVAPAIALDVRSRLGHVPYMFTVRGGFHGSALPFVRRGPLAQSGQGDADVRPGRRKRVPAPALARDGRQAGLPELRLPGLL